jgi:hypothetical protein
MHRRLILDGFTGYPTASNDDSMIADTGATVHIRKDTSNMYDLREGKCIVKYENGSTSTSMMMVTWSGLIDNDGQETKIRLENVAVVPEAP